MTFTGQNNRRLTGQKNMSFLLQNCSINNLTGSAEFGFSDKGSNSIKFRFEQGKIFDFNNVNIFSYIEDETFTISGNISDTKYSYKINDIAVVEGATKANFELKDFFINTTNCNVNTDLNIYADPTAYSVTVPENIDAGSTFNVNLVNSSSDSTIEVFAVSLDASSANSFSMGSFTSPLSIAPSATGTFSLTNTNTSIGSSYIHLTFSTNIGEIKKMFTVVVNQAPTYTVTNVLSPVSITETSVNIDGEPITGRLFTYAFQSMVYKYDHSSAANTGFIDQQATVSLEYVSGSIGTFNKVIDVDITNGGTGYTSESTVTFGTATSPDIQSAGTVVIGGGGAISSVAMTNYGNMYDAVPSVAFSGAGSSAAGTAQTVSYNKTFTNCFDVETFLWGGTGSTSTSHTKFLSSGFTQNQGDASYPHGTHGSGMYEQPSPTAVQRDLGTLGNRFALYIKIFYTDKEDYHPISAKLKVESQYQDTTTGRTVEEANLVIAETVP